MRLLVWSMSGSKAPKMVMAMRSGVAKMLVL